MTERTIDAERAGGTDTTARSLAVPEMSFDEAIEYHAKFAGRMVPTKSDQARAALIREIEQLRMEKANLQKICRIENAEVRRLIDEVERFSDALPGIIGCVDGNAAACHERRSAFRCCELRCLFAEHGLLPAIEKAADQEDGA